MKNRIKHIANVFLKIAGIQTLTLMLAMFVASSPALAAPNPERFGDEFPIMGWIGPPDGWQTLARYNEMADAGLTVSLNHPMDKLALAEQAGLLAIVGDDSRISLPLGIDDLSIIQSQLNGLLAECDGHPAVAGFFLDDEPGADYFPNLARVNKYLRQELPGCFPYINLFPLGVSTNLLETDSYTNYLQQFISDVEPAVVSYDNYPCINQGWRPDYYENLEIVRQHALDSELPFWAFALTTEHLYYRDPTEADVRLQVYSDLVYGAKGICYFCYWQPVPTDYFLSAIITRDGERTEHFGQVQLINARVKTMGKVLLKSTSTNVYHTAPLPTATSLLPADSPVYCTSDALIFGFFTHDNGDEYVMIVNRDYVNDLDTNLQLTDVLHLKEVAPLDETWLHTPDGSGNLPFSLDAGDARLFKIVTATSTEAYTLAYAADANGSISGTSPQTVDWGDDGTSVTAVPDAHYLFVDWSDGRTDNPRTDLDVMDNLTVTANFFQLNAIPYAETFEAYTNGFAMAGGAPGWMVPTSANAVVVTNSTWTGPLSAYSEACGYPTNTTHDKVLEMNGTARNLFDMAANQIVWADCMVMPVHALLTTDTNVLAGVQVAVGFNTNSHPAVWHYDVAGASNCWTVVDEVTVSTGEWVRLTVMFDYQTDDPTNSVRYFQVRMDGNLLTNALAWTANDGSGTAGGSWFAMSSEPDRLSQLALRAEKSAAAMDDLVVTTDNPLAREVEIVSAHGQAAPAVGIHSYTFGDSVSLSLTNETVTQGINQFVYANWNMGGHAPASGSGTNVQITLTNDLMLTWLWTTNNSLTVNGTPIWWLTSHGLSTGDDGEDTDSDGIPTWQEWTCDTVPNDSNSVLKITDIEPDGAGMKVYWKGGVQATQVLEQRTNLVSGTDWTPVVSNVPPTSTTNSFSDSSATNPAGFYRINAWR